MQQPFQLLAAQVAGFLFWEFFAFMIICLEMFTNLLQISSKVKQINYIFN